MVLSTGGTIGRRVGTGTSFGGSAAVSSGWQNYLGQVDQAAYTPPTSTATPKVRLLIQDTDDTIGALLDFGTSFPLTPAGRTTSGRPAPPVLKISPPVLEDLTVSPGKPRRK
uniref:Uncharacterized protein n=1 Tax=Streptomyces sp. NBC_00003 TaxID=2903608 RepID=A0AAU2UVS9_9ACTN